MTDDLYQTYLDAIDELTRTIAAAPRARTSAQARARTELDAIDQRRRAETDQLATRLAEAKSTYRRVASTLDEPDLADLGLHLPATLRPEEGAAGSLEDAEHEQHRAVVALAGAIGDHRVRRSTQAQAALDAAEALAARRAALEAARNQPPRRTFDPRVLVLAGGIVLVLLVVIIVFVI